MSVDETLRYLSPEAFKIYLRFVSAKPLVLKGLTEKLKKSKVTSSSSGNVILDKKRHFRRQRYLFWLRWLIYPRLLWLKPPTVHLGRRGRQECNVWLSIEKEAAKLAEVCECTSGFGLEFVHCIVMWWERALLLAKLQCLRGWLILSITFCCPASRVMCFMQSLLSVIKV